MSLSAADEEALAAFEAEREAFEQQQQQPQSHHAQQPQTGGASVNPFHPTPFTKPQSAPANPFTNNSTQPQKGKVLSITRSEVFSGQPRTVMKVLLEKGGERTITADANGNVKIAIDIEVGDQVKLAQVGPMQMEWNKVSAVLEKVRKKRKLFNIAVLLSQDGLPKLYNSFPSIAWETRPGYETRFLTQLVTLYKTWAFALWPKMSFQLFVDRVEKLGTKMQLKDILSDMRYGKVPDWSMYEEMDDNGETSADREAKKTKNKVQLNPQAEEIFNALTTKRALGQKGANGDADGIDDDDEDAIMAALADKYSQKDPSASSGKGGEENIHALQAKKRAMELERQRKDEEEYALMQARYEEEQELDLFARPGNIFTSSNNNKNSEVEKRGKKRARVLEDEEEEEEEAVFAPMSSQAPAASQEEAEVLATAIPTADAPAQEATSADATTDASHTESNVNNISESTRQQMDTSETPVIVPATASEPVEGTAEPMSTTADEAAVEPVSDNNTNSEPVIVSATNDTTQVTEPMQVEGATQTQLQVEGVRSATPPASPSREDNTTSSQEASLSLPISQTQQQEEMLEGNMDEFLAEQEAADAAAASTSNETSVPAETNHDSVAPTAVVPEAETQAVTQRFSPTAFFE